jgi:hypothetical protein
MATAMADNRFQRATELPLHLKQALEALLGRSIQADECVSIRTYRPTTAPEGEERGAAYRRLLDRANRTAARTKNVSDTEVDAAIDEAADTVRHKPE